MIASNSRNVSNSKKVIRYARKSLDADNSREPTAAGTPARAGLQQ